MVEPNRPIHFTGFAGLSVPTPATAGLYGTTEEYFGGVGQDHAIMVANDVLRLWRDPDFRTPYDITEAVVAFRPTVDPDLNLGGESEYDDEDYVTGFVYELVEEAARMRAAIDVQRRGGTYQPTLYGADQRRLGDWTAGFQARRGDLPASTVLTVAHELDELVRTISEYNDIELPQRLQHADELRMDEAENLAALAELTVAIDRYSLHRAAPALVSTVQGLSGEQAQALERDRLAARVAVLDAQAPHLLARLSADRAQVVHDLWPDSGTRGHTEDSSALPSTSPVATSDDVRIFTEAVEWAWTWLDAQSPSTVTAAELAPVSSFLDTIADAARRDPALADRLPTIQAGLVRHLAELHRPPEDTTQGPSDLGPPPTSELSAGTSDSAEQVNTAPAVASVQGRAVASGLSRNQRPGTAGTRHATSTHQPGSGRIR